MDTPWSMHALKPHKICLAVCEGCHLVSICFLSKFTATSGNLKSLPSTKGLGPLVKFLSHHDLNLHFPARSQVPLMACGAVNNCSITCSIACCGEGTLYIAALSLSTLRCLKCRQRSDFHLVLDFYDKNTTR